MKTKSKFKALPPEDQQKIFALCDQHTFSQVVEILAQPRPEGLELQTSYSALRRFYIEYHPDAQHLEVLKQYAQSLKISRQASHNSFTAAVLTVVESRILESLKNGKAIADLEKEFRTMVRIQKSFLALEKWRTDADIKAFEDYSLELDLRAHHPDQIPDFKPVTPGAEPEPFEPEPLEDDDADLNIPEEKAAIIDQMIASNDKQALREYIEKEGIPIEAVGMRIIASRERAAAELEAHPTKENLAVAAILRRKMPVKPHYPPKATNQVQPPLKGGAPSLGTGTQT